MNILIYFLLAVEVLVSLLIVLLVLMQRPKSEGLGAAFGGGMTENLFGAQTTNVLQKATRWLGGIFFAAALMLSMLYSRESREGGQSLIQKQLSSAPVPKDTGTSPLTPQEAALKKMLEQKIKEATDKSGTNAKPGVSPAPVNSALPAASPAESGSEAPALQLQTTVPESGTGLGVGGAMPTPGLQIPTGTTGK